MTPDFFSCAGNYLDRLTAAFRSADVSVIEALALDLYQARQEGRQVFIFGNGGSAANAVHIANDFFYGIDRQGGRGLKVQALTANVAIVTCLGNDVGYEQIFASQLDNLAAPGDLVIGLSGSGNSPNIVAALEASRRIGTRSYAILGYAGGKALALADRAIHFKIDDMQISEDLQLIVGHQLMQWLSHRIQAES